MDNESWLSAKESDDMTILPTLNSPREKYVLRNAKTQDFTVASSISKNLATGDYDRKSPGMEISHGN